MAITRDEVVAYLSRLGPAALQDLMLELEDLWGLEKPYTGPEYAIMGAPLEYYMPPGAPEIAVVLLSTGPRRVQVMKTLRETVKLELAAVRELINATPAVVARDVSRDYACELQRELEAVGAKVEIREA